MVAVVRGGDADAKTSGAGADRGGPDWGDEEAKLTQTLGGGNSAGVGPEEEGKDGSRGLLKGETEEAAKVADVGSKSVPKAVAFTGEDDGNGRERCGGNWGRLGGGKQEGSGPVHEVVAEKWCAGDEGAGCAERLSEGPDNGKRADAEVAAEAGAGRTQGANGMGLIDDESGVVGGSERCEVGEGS